MKLVSIAAPIVLLLAAAAAWAEEEPKGFAEIPWGTPSYKVHDALNGKSCRFWRSDAEVSFCDGYYALPSVGSVNLIFWSIPKVGAGQHEGRLAGYTIMLAASGYVSMRSIAIEKFGPPAARRTLSYTLGTGTGGAVNGEELSWSWPGATAVLTQLCWKVRDSCLAVRTKELTDLLAQRAVSDRAKSKKAF